MPGSSEAITGRYNPKFFPKQDYNRAPRESVRVHVDNLNEIPSASTNTSTTKRRWIIGGLITMGVLSLCAGVGTPLALTYSQSSSAGSAASSNVNTGSTASTAGNTGFTASSTVSTGSTASTTISTSSVSSITTSAAGFSAGGVVLSSTSAWYGYEQVTVSCSVNLINVTVIITVQRTVNATYSGAFSTFWGGTMNQAYSSIGTQIIYTWTIVSGQTIQSSGSPYTAQAQFSLFGVNQITSADTYQVTATTAGGVTSTLAGHF